MEGKSVGGVHVKSINVTHGVGAIIGYPDGIRKVMPGINGVRIIGLGNRKVCFVGRHSYSAEANVKSTLPGIVVFYA